jgi:hypothetical protein
MQPRRRVIARGVSDLERSLPPTQPRCCGGWPAAPAEALSNGGEHQQYSTDPDEQHREATRPVLVGGTAGVSIAASHRAVKEEPGCHQSNAENLDGATHVSSLQVRVAMTLT